jgi:hypothetical protein
LLFQVAFGYAQSVQIVNKNGESQFFNNGKLALREERTVFIKTVKYNKLLYDIEVNHKAFELEYKTGSLDSIISRSSDSKIIIQDLTKDPSLRSDLNNYQPLFQYNVGLLASSYKSILAIRNRSDFEARLKETNKKLEEALNNFHLVYNRFLIDTSISKEVHNLIADKYNQLQKLDKIRDSIDVGHIFNFCYSLRAEGDEMDIEITIKEKSRPVNIYTEKYNAKVYGGLRVDFHTGVVFEFFNSDEQYSFKEINAETVRLIENTNGLSFSPAISLFTNVYYRSKYAVSPGFSLGFGLNNNAILSYFAGISGIIGEKKRFIVTAGPSISKRDVLKSKYAAGNVFAKDSRPENSDLIEKAFKPGLFISLGYNLNVNRILVSSD